MALSSMPANTGLLGGGKALKVGLGFLTGGPLGAGMALIGANNPKLGAAAELAGALKGGGSSDTKTPDSSGGAIGRKLASADSAPAAPAEDHAAIIAAGREALDHPDVPPHIAAMAAPYILGAYHFQGPHPMIDDAAGGGDIA